MREHEVSGKTFMVWLAALGLLVVGFMVGRTRADGQPAVPQALEATGVATEAIGQLPLDPALGPGESEITDGADRTEDISAELASYEVEVLTPGEDPSSGARATATPRHEERPPVVAPAVHRPEPVVAIQPPSTPAPRPAPPAPREPESVSLLVPSGTHLVIRFERTLSSHTSEVGEPFRVELTEDVAAGGRTAIPGGSIIHGTVTEADPAKKIGGRAKLALDFQYLELPSGERIPIDAVFAEQGRSQTAKDAGIIAGSVVGGAILGEAVDEGQGTAVGAVVGGVVGAVVAKETRAKRVEVPIGTVTTLELASPVTVDVFVD